MPERGGNDSEADDAGGSTIVAWLALILLVCVLMVGGLLLYSFVVG